jgi:DNA mismatch endonuclease (patch repair protein)
MTDRLTRAQRSRTMSLIRSTETSLEREFRKLLWGHGLRYRKNVRMEGTPDIVFPRWKVAVFLDSCFWHLCRFHCRMPKSNKSFWQKKLVRNRARDRATTRRLRYRGWIVVRIWEHALVQNPNRCVDLVVRALERAKTSP